jgi:hypothetical protein
MSTHGMNDAWAVRSRGVCRAGLALASAVVAIALLGGMSQSLAAQVDEPQAQEANRISVFFDCEGRQCDAGAKTFYRTELSWVNWVRDRTDSDVHLIMTSQRTGSGGYQFQLDFVGRETLAGVEDQLFFTSLGTDVEQEELDGLSTVFGVGLARFSALLGYREFVVFEPVVARRGPIQPRLLESGEVDDPWNLWVFRVGGSGRLNGSDAFVTKNLDGNFSASRTTLTWKLNFSGAFGIDRREIHLNDSTTFVTEEDDWAFNTQTIYALAENWSLGLITQSAKMPNVNQKFRAEVTPAFEYSFFPYPEATRRALTARYTVGPAYREYVERTVYGEDSEIRWEQAIQFRFAQRQPWGDGSMSLTGSHFLHDSELFNVSWRGNISVRVARGLNVNAGANVSRVTDQIYLSAGGVSDEQILLGLRSRATDYNYGFNVGFSYQFGSIFNNVVNNRWPRVGLGG